MAGSAAKRKTALDTLLQKVSKIVEEGAEEMNEEELRQSEQRINDRLSRAVAERKSRRETG
jgi:hypothetical protein